MLSKIEFASLLQHIVGKESTLVDNKVKGDATMAKENPETSPSMADLTIQLDHFLQACGVPTGGQAKRLIQSGEILVNDKVETRRKMKLRPGDVVVFDGEEFEVAVDESVDEDVPEGS